MNRRNSHQWDLTEAGMAELLLVTKGSDAGGDALRCVGVRDLFPIRTMLTDCSAYVPTS